MTMTDAEIDAAWEAHLEEIAHVNDDPDETPPAPATATVIPAGALFEARERTAAVTRKGSVRKDVRRIAEFAGVDPYALAAVLKSAK